MISASSERTRKNNNSTQKRRIANGSDMQRVRLSLALRGEIARILIELRRRGVIRSYSDGVCQGIRLFYEKVLEQDLRSARLKALEASLQKDELIGA